MAAVRRRPAVASLAASLDVRGVREQALQAALMKLLERRAAATRKNLGGRSLDPSLDAEL